MISPSTLGSPSLPSTSHQPLRSYLFNPFHNFYPHTHSPGPHPHSLSSGPPPHSFLIPPSKPISGMPFSMAISLHKMSWPLKKKIPSISLEYMHIILCISHSSCYLPFTLSSMLLWVTTASAMPVTQELFKKVPRMKRFFFDVQLESYFSTRLLLFSLYNQLF